MRHLAITFFVIAGLAAIFGFGGIAKGATGLLSATFFVFLALFVIAGLAALYGPKRISK